MRLVASFQQFPSVEIEQDDGSVAATICLMLLPSDAAGVEVGYQFESIEPAAGWQSGHGWRKVTVEVLISVH